MKKLKIVFFALTLLVSFCQPNSWAQEKKSCNKSSNINCKAKVMKTASKTFIYEKEMQWEPAGEGVVRQIMGYDSQLMLVKVKFEKGAIGTPHAHYHSQTTYIVSGKFEFTVGDEKKIVEAGDGLYVAPDTNHGCVCLEPGVLIDCFSPMRADFLGKK